MLGKYNAKIIGRMTDDRSLWNLEFNH